jgi:hypothetical protein
MAGKKLTDKVIDITTASVSLGVGGIVVGGLGSIGNPQVQRIAETSQRGLGLASVALPVAGAGAVLDELAKLGKKR